MKFGIVLNLNYISRDNMYRLQTSRRDIIISIYNALYNKSNFYLLRKYNKFCYYANTEVNQIISDTVTRKDEIIPQEYGTSIKIEENVR